MSVSEHVHGENGLGGVKPCRSPKEAISHKSFEHIYRRIMSHKEKITWTNTGALTNLCLLLMNYPDVKNKLKEIVLMGGAIDAGNVTPAA